MVCVGLGVTMATTSSSVIRAIGEIEPELFQLAGQKQRAILRRQLFEHGERLRREGFTNFFRFSTQPRRNIAAFRLLTLGGVTGGDELFEKSCRRILCGVAKDQQTVGIGRGAKIQQRLFLLGGDEPLFARAGGEKAWLAHNDDAPLGHERQTARQHEDLRQTHLFAVDALKVERAGVRIRKHPLEQLFYGLVHAQTVVAPDPGDRRSSQQMDFSWHLC